MVTFFPNMNFIKNKRLPKPEPGESFLLDWLNEYLSGINGEFEVYFQGNLNGEFPDIVIMRKNHGALIIEVKDWELSKYSIKDKGTWTCLYPRGRRAPVDVRSPIKQAKNYKNLFFEAYSITLARSRLRGEKSYSAIDSAVFFSKSTGDEVKRFFGRNLQQSEGNLLDSDHIICLRRIY